MQTFEQRLADDVKSTGHLCVGIDPRFESLPTSFRHNPPTVAIEAFCNLVLETVRPYSAVVKYQSAFFEALGPDGFKVLFNSIAAAKNLGFTIILDAKRGDIASTAEAYAAAAFEQFRCHALTVNPYLGEDAVEPFVRAARLHNGSLFVLVRTSNAGSGLFQNLMCNGQPLYRHVADAVNRWGVGAVVGATHPNELKELRAAMPKAWFLVPGYGAQGGTAADVRAAFPNAIVNSSRGILFPFRPDDADWRQKIEQAARAAQAELKANG